MTQTSDFLSPAFVSQYRGIRPRNAGVLFDVVYLRTYSRWVESKKRRETWDETVARVVEYSLSLYQGSASRGQLVAEAELMFDKIFHLEVMPSGRTLWVGGTESAKKFGESQYNCSFCCIDSLDAFGDLFQLLLCGCGAGFRVLPEDIAKLPDFNPGVQVFHKEYMFLGENKEDETTVDYDIPYFTITIGDSREAWVGALREFLDLATCRDPLKVILNYDNIRPEGSRIKSFGGKAPGHTGLQEMFTNVAKVIQNCSGRLTAVDAMDICNYIGKNVIVGGTRRSSQIALGCPNDEEFVSAKKELWTTKQNLQRTMSNNSVVFNSHPSLEQVKEIFKGIKNNGEPGFFNIKAANARRPGVYGLNPCAEILLNSKGFCNLSTVNLMAFVNNGVFDLPKACEAFRLATRIGLRVTNVTVSLPEWDKVQKSDRLLGVSLTGLMDMFDAIGVEFDSYAGRNILADLRSAANDEADKYAFEMRVPRPLLVTCIKPEGTLSQLPTVSSGLHRAYAPYYIRRIRVSSMDAVAQALIKLGVPNEPDKGKAERLVFSFPIKTQATISAADEPASRQLDRYLTTMEHYTDHNSSCTITVGEDEWEGMEKMVHDNFSSIIAAAFLPKYTDAYPQMPYEAITREQYDEIQATFPSLETLAELVNEFEQEETEDELEADCSSGFCPVR